MNDSIKSSIPSTRSNAKLPFAFNVLISMTLFVLLVQLFDPYSAFPNNSYSNQLLHHDNPVIQSFSQNGLKSTGSQELWTGRERLYRMLQDAGLASSLNALNISTLPTQHIIDQHYGPSVVMVGMDECETYRSMVPLADRQLAVAGMFNTGTNLLDTQIRKNVRLPKPNIWQVPWGKHRMAASKLNHTAKDMEKYNKTAVLPVVVIRHPLAWLSSMCKNPYAAQWRHGSKIRCPNLVITPPDRKAFSHLQGNSYTVTVKFDENNRKHFDSLVHLWSEWYRQYYDVNYPMLMVRFEDLVFAPSVVLNDIAKCVGGQMKADTFQYQTKTSKSHGSGTDLLAAVRKTAKLSPLSEPADVSYAQQHLDAQLMNLFHYKVELEAP